MTNPGDPLISSSSPSHEVIGPVGEEQVHQQRRQALGPRFLLPPSLLSFSGARTEGGRDCWAGRCRLGKEKKQGIQESVTPIRSLGDTIALQLL